MRRTVILKNIDYSARLVEPESDDIYDEIKPIPQVFIEKRKEQVIQEEEEEEIKELTRDELLSRQYPIFNSLFGRKIKTAYEEPIEIEPIREIDFDPVMPFVKRAFEEQQNSQIQEEKNNYVETRKESEIKTDFYFLQYPEEPKYDIYAGFEFENYVDPREFALEMKRISISNVRSPPAPVEENGFEFSVEFKPQIEVKKRNIFTAAPQEDTSYSSKPDFKPGNSKFQKGSYKGKKPYKGKK